MAEYKFKNLIFIIPILALIAGSIFYNTKAKTELTSAVEGDHVIINKVAINVLIADEISEHWQGLSDRESLDPMTGMLFLFPEKQKKTFVMRRMHFPLDIIWIEDDKIVGIAKNLEPEGVEPINKYPSILPVNRVLEVKGGFTDKYGIKIGDKLTYNLE